VNDRADLIRLHPVDACGYGQGGAVIERARRSQSALLLPRFEGGVIGHPVQPSGDTPSNGLRSHCQGKECRLERVLGRMVVAGNAQADAPHHVCVSAQE
jgi:hypothetical protein